MNRRIVDYSQSRVYNEKSFPRDGVITMAFHTIGKRVVSVIGVVYLVATALSGCVAEKAAGKTIEYDVYAVYQADQDGLSDAEFQDKLQAAAEVLSERLADWGYESAIRIQAPDCIRVEASSGDEDMSAVFAEAGKQAELKIRDSDGNVWITGDNVKAASAKKDESTGEYVVQIYFDSGGAELFGEMTAAAYEAGTNIDIYLDEQLLCSAGVMAGAIDGGEAVIGGGFSQEEAKAVAVSVSSGPIPLRLTEIDNGMIREQE
jgi:preprotein translocase subunit SecD